MSYVSKNFKARNCNLFDKAKEFLQIYFIKIIFEIQIRVCNYLLIPNPVNGAKNLTMAGINNRTVINRTA